MPTFPEHELTAHASALRSVARALVGTQWL